ncbi:hypothetical protein LX77_02604 [Gelidibacter algens]|uniref:Secreted protein (Por secretion system target) n=1 Tax=Gelidibacter algens TaxID=49280 RepID=A0A1A7R0Y9_9FLAO|nr:IPT/TIG domain-containing protein [Gelidibacter algens]OBX25491.1 hypothetical protein A9996_09970 [Gelidibacter algens]RAJ22292.1 hypothetical protein LX77_02604 [Gelidibacter algens]
MITKITPNYSKIALFNGLLVAVMLLIAVGSYAQVVVTSVSPTRVTQKTTITISGSGFGASTPISFAGNAISFNRNSWAPNEIVIEITTPTLDNNISAMLIVNGSNASMITFVGPSEKTLENNSENRIREVYTSWNGFWKSSQFNKDVRETFPNNKHDLLGFKMNYSSEDIIFSTGVNDSLLEANLTAQGVNVSDATKYIRQGFKAYSTNGIKGRTHKDNYLAMADMIDGEKDIRVLNDNVRRTVYDVIIDGSNGQGLELGTGIANFNQNTNIRFFSGNGKVGALDDVPDLLITQIADPNRNKPDIYYYADLEGNVVGRPIRLKIDDNDTSSLRLFEWRLDLYKMINPTAYEVSLPQESGSLSSGQTRPYRMGAFKLSDFGIEGDSLNPQTYIGNINNINMMAGGAADVSFIAYNKKAFDIKSPTIDLVPISRNVCETDIEKSVTFNTRALIENGTGSSEEELKYKWFKNNESIMGANNDNYTIPAVVASDINENYRVRIYNEFGAIDLNFALSLGGTPTFWDGSNWKYPSSFYDEGTLRFPISEADRNLIFSENYTGELVDLEGCDCRVIGGKEVIIPSGHTIKLYRNLVVDVPIDIFNESGVKIDETKAGKFTLEDNASLIQTKPVNMNQNSGEIIVKRTAKQLQMFDYVYWSSPVADFKVGDLRGTRNYEWNVTQINTNNTVGNWVEPPSPGFMMPGKGYIVRVPTPITTFPTPPIEKDDIFELTSTLTGRPNNGEYRIKIYETGSDGDISRMVEGDKDWNLIGNPYPSAISAEKFLIANAGVVNRDEIVYDGGIIKGGLYLWTHKSKIEKGGGNPYYENFGYNYNSTDYLVYNGTASTNPKFEGYIASGQGFFVRAKANNVDVNFTNAMRFETGQANYDNSDFFRSNGDSKNAKSSDSEKQLLWLALTNEAKTATVAVVGYVQGATYGEDNLYDASHMGTNDFSLYTQVSEERLAIQGRPLPFDSSDKVTLGVAVPTNGIYNIGIDHLKGSIMGNTEQAIFLEDTYQNVFHDLRKSPYSFTATAGDMKDRFVLRYTDRQLSVDEQQLSDTFVYVKNDQLHVRAAKNIEAIVVYDLTGKKLVDHHMGGNSDSLSTPFQFPKGVYLTVITLENSGSVTKKVMN